MKLIRTRAKDDCVICTVAMLLDVSYEESCKLFPRYFEPVQDVWIRGASDTEVVYTLWNCGYGLVNLVLATKDPRGITIDLSNEILILMRRRPALITTVSGSRRHAVAWDGKLIFDPNKNKSCKLLNNYTIESVSLLVKLN